jgi:hypothetical protein
MQDTAQAAHPRHRHRRGRHRRLDGGRQPEASFRRRAGQHHPDRVLRDRHDRGGRGDDPDHPPLLPGPGPVRHRRAARHRRHLQAGHPLQRLVGARIVVHPPLRPVRPGPEGRGVPPLLDAPEGPGRGRADRRVFAGRQPGRRRQVHHPVAQSALDPVGVRLGAAFRRQPVRPADAPGRRAERRAAHRRQDRQDQPARRGRLHRVGHAGQRRDGGRRPVHRLLGLPRPADRGGPAHRLRGLEPVAAVRQRPGRAERRQGAPPPYTDVTARSGRLAVADPAAAPLGQRLRLFQPPHLRRGRAQGPDRRRWTSACCTSRARSASIPAAA